MDFMKFKTAVAARFEMMAPFGLFRTTMPKENESLSNASLDELRAMLGSL